MSLLRAENLYKIYQTESEEVPAVKGVNLELQMGELSLLMGPSGSGKTTLLSILGCILRPDQGKLLISEEEVDWTESKLPALRLKYFGFIYQQFNLLSSLNVRENVEIPLMLQGKRGGFAEELADHALGTVSLTHRARFNTATLSGGEKQRVAIARAIVNDPPILLADEPTGNLDSQNGIRIMTALRDLAVEKGKTILVVTHDTRYNSFADKIYRMEDGEVFLT